MRKKKIKVSKKGLVMLLASVITVVGSSSGSVAWLADITQGTANQMTISTVTAQFDRGAVSSTFSLQRGDDALYLTPGTTLTVEAPPVRVMQNSEDCYLFLKIDEDIGSLPSAPFSSYLQYAVADGWTAAEGDNIPAGVYYRIVQRSDEDQLFVLIRGSAVKVSDNITEKALNMLMLPDAELPTLNFTAYAVQLTGDGITPFSVAQAWANIGAHVGSS